MGEYLITTDNMSDLPEEYLKEHQIKTCSLSYMLEGERYTSKNGMDSHLFYEKMRNGSMPTTSQVNPEEAKQDLKEFLKEDKDIIHIAFSSGLSGTYNSMQIAARELEEEGCRHRITIIDSLSASLGEGLLVHKALEQQKKGLSYDEMVQWIENHKRNICHNFTVDDLFHLYRGGRVSKTTAILGTMIKIKPVLHVNDEGHLINVSKAHGRKKALAELVASMERQIGSYRDKNDVVFISHGDCIEDVKFVQKLVEEKFGIHEFVINYVGPTIGAHSGPGTVALFYMGDVR